MMSDHRTHTFSDGTTVRLNRIPATVLEHITTSQVGKPTPPMVAVTYAGKITRNEPNPNDSDYQDALAEWTLEKNKRVLMFLINKGVADDPPQEFVDEWLPYLAAGAPLREVKYLWIAEKIGDDVEDLTEDSLEDSEITRFMNSVMGLSYVTAEGIVESEARFPNDSEQSSDNGLSLQPETSN